MAGSRSGTASRRGCRGRGGAWWISGRLRTSRPLGRGGGGGKEDRTLAKVMLGLRAGKSPHQMTGDIYGASHVAADWYSDGGMRSQIRRWIPEAKALAEGGWRDLVPRHVTGE